MNTKVLGKFSDVLKALMELQNRERDIEELKELSGSNNTFSAWYNNNSQLCSECVRAQRRVGRPTLLRVLEPSSMIENERMPRVVRPLSSKS